MQKSDYQKIILRYEVRPFNKDSSYTDFAFLCLDEKRHRSEFEETKKRMLPVTNSEKRVSPNLKDVKDLLKKFTDDTSP